MSQSLVPARFRAALLASLGLLSACGGGGGGSSLGGSSASDGVPLATDADVERELSNIGAITALIRNAQSGFASASTASTSVRSSQTLTAQPKMQTVQPQASTTQSCPGGGTAVVSAGTASHTFSYFSVTQSVTYAIADFSNCIESQQNSDSSITTVTLNNHGEAGSTTTASDGTQYIYALLGSGSTPLSVHQVETASGGSVTLDATDLLLGTLEAEGQNAFIDIRTILQDDHTENRSTGTYIATIDLGSGSTPFKETENSGVTSTLDGPYTYATSLCTGGALTLATPTALTVDSNNYPVGGTLKFASGNASATVNFNSDGSASIQFSTGGTGALSATQVHTSLDTPEC